MLDGKEKGSRFALQVSTKDKIMCGFATAILIGCAILYCTGKGTTSKQDVHNQVGGTVPHLSIQTRSGLTDLRDFTANHWTVMFYSDVPLLYRESTENLEEAVKYLDVLVERHRGRQLQALYLLDAEHDRRNLFGALEKATPPAGVEFATPVGDARKSLLPPARLRDGPLVFTMLISPLV